MKISSFQKADQIIAQMEEKIVCPTPGDYKGKLHVGVDLETANVVVTVLVENKQPLSGALQEAWVVKDGLWL